MSALDDSARESVVRAERALLGALCEPWLAAEDRTNILLGLETHRFAEPDNEVIYRALLVMPAELQGDMFTALTRMATRMGFPDIEIADYFSRNPLTSAEIRELLSQL